MKLLILNEVLVSSFKNSIGLLPIELDVKRTTIPIEIIFFSYSRLTAYPNQNY